MTQAIKFWKDRAKRAESTLMAVTDDLKRAEATNEDLLEALEAITGYADCALDQFQKRRGFLDISDFHRLTKEARQAIKEAKEL